VTGPGGADGDPGEAVTALADFRRVLQIAINLIGNAIAYSPAGSTVSVRVARDPAGVAALVVSDQGPGITAQQAERIFDKFERLGRSNDGGSGLGLYISRRLARAMDGDLTLVPSDAEGAHFRLELPAFDRAQ
jgi:signal transduction histidine kinase